MAQELCGSRALWLKGLWLKGRWLKGLWLGRLSFLGGDGKCFTASREDAENRLGQGVEGTIPVGFKLKT